MPDTELLVGAVLALGLLVALVCPPPAVNRSYESVLLALAASAMYLISVTVALAFDVHLGALLAAPGVLAFCASCWLSRGPDRDSGGGGGDDGDDEPDPPIDWDDFDRIRAGWDRPRVGA